MNTLHDPRVFFPAGLYQPPGSFRFSVDALLLAAFAAESLKEAPGEPLILDLGCGCGVVGLAALLLRPSCRVLGVDVQDDLARAARDNARSLGLAGRFAAETLDLAEARDREKLPRGACALVTANPPFHRAGTGRLPSNASRRRALFAQPETLPAFLAAARPALAPGAALALVYPAKDREPLRRALAAAGFASSRVLPVRSRRHDPPIRILVLARQEPFPGSPHPDEEPLTLFRDESRAYTSEAVLFCPFLKPGTPGRTDAPAL